MQQLTSTMDSDWQEADRLAYMHTLLEGYARAEQAVGGVTRNYTIAGCHVRLRFAGPALVPHLTPALAHLESDTTDAPTLTIHLWDTVSTGTRLPLLADSLVQLVRLRWFEQLDTRREIKGYHSERFRTTFHLGPDILSALDTRTGQAVYWVEDATTLPYYERSYPLRGLLNWGLASQQRHFVHAGAVGLPTGGVLLAGQGWSGKSTTTLACLNSDLAFASDDYTVVATEPQPYAYSLYNTAKLHKAEDMTKFPHLLGSVSNPATMHAEEPIIFLHEQHPHKVLSGFPLRAILLPRITGQPDTSVQPVARIAALKALAPSTILQLPGAGQSSFNAMARLISQVPCYTLALGTDLAQIPHVILALLGELA